MYSFCAQGMLLTEAATTDLKQRSSQDMTSLSSLSCERLDMPSVNSHSAWYGPHLYTSTQVHNCFVVLQKRWMMTDLVCSKLGGPDHTHEAAMTRH